MLSKDYILGFVEGEGCFSVLIQKCIDRKPRAGKWIAKKKNPRLLRVSLTFRITNVEANLPLLEEIKASIGVGSIYSQNRGSDRLSNVSYFYTKSLMEAQKVKDYFSTLTFKTTKGKDFVLWCKCLELMEQKKHLTKEGILEICQLRDQMNIRKTKNKWTTEEIRKVLDDKPAHITAHIDSNQQQLIHNQNPASESWLTLKQGNSKPNRFVDAKK